MFDCRVVGCVGSRAVVLRVCPREASAVIGSAGSAVVSLEYKLLRLRPHKLFLLRCVFSVVPDSGMTSTLGSASRVDDAFSLKKQPPTAVVSLWC